MTSATSRECRLIRPAADRGCVFLHCRNHAVTMAHRAGGCHAPWAVFLPYRFNGSPCFFINLIDKSFSHRHSCRVVAGKHHSFFGREKTRKEAALDACSHPFRVFQNSGLFNSHRLFSLKKLCVAQMGIAIPLSTFSIPKNSAHNLVSPIGGKTISNKSSMIILRPSEERIYT